MGCKKHNMQERTERRISAAASLALCGLTLLLQIVITLLLTRFLHDKAHVCYAILEAAGAVFAIRVYLRSGSPSYKLVWMCLLLAVPVAGMVLFLLWGGARQAKSLSLKKIPPPEEPESAWKESRQSVEALGQVLPAWSRLASYLQKRGFLLYRNSRAAYFGDGAAYFDDLTAHIAGARRYIFLEYYILAEGKVWDRIFDALRERAAAGVEVCVIFDDFGNLTRFSDESLQKLQDAGIKAEVFNPVHRYVNRIYFNYRDHRKIVVIDGLYAYTGGINIGDEYANIIDRFGHWKDSAVRITGDGAWGFARQFIQMWKMIGRTLSCEDDAYRPQETAEGTGWCQPFSDGPLNNPDNPVEESYLQLISSARHTLYITTPYYAVEDSMQQALCIAADAGVDVRLCIPAVPDHKFTYMVAETYWGELLRHGVRIYKYAPGFLHAKSVVADRELALVGSTNMDYRTFQLHHECAVLMYGMPVVEEVLEDMNAIMAVSTPYTLEQWQARPWYRRAFASVLRLGAIWL